MKFLPWPCTRFRCCLHPSSLIVQSVYGFRAKVFRKVLFSKVERWWTCSSRRGYYILCSSAWMLGFWVFGSFESRARAQGSQFSRNVKCQVMSNAKSSSPCPCAYVLCLASLPARWPDASACPACTNFWTSCRHCPGSRSKTLNRKPKP